MEIKQAQLIVTGMNQDLSVSKFTPDLTFENRNIRITALNENSSLSVTNEQGNTKVLSLEGEAIGYCAFTQYLVVFTTSDTADRIYRIEYKDGAYESIRIFSGEANFSKKHPLECLPYFETEYVQKVYWVDGINQPRTINIADIDENTPITEDYFTNASEFDFSSDLALNEGITITKGYGLGQFPSGTVQYAFTYYNKNGIESNIYYTSPLYYTSPTQDRAGREDELNACYFTIKIENLDPNFKYTRVYSIIRTSEDTTPQIKKVVDLKIPESSNPSVQFTDTNTGGSVENSDILLYIGGEELIVGTIASKDNTLFAGNLSLKRPSMEQLKKLWQDNISETGIEWVYSDYAESNLLNQSEDLTSTTNTLYPYIPITLNYDSSQIKHFKYGEYYRFGIQAQWKNGIWSEPIYIGEDAQCNRRYRFLINETGSTGKYTIKPVMAMLHIRPTISQALLNLGYKKIRPVMVPLTMSDRRVLCQGVLNSTMFIYGNRRGNNPFAFPDYALRPHYFGASLADSRSWLGDSKDVPSPLVPASTVPAATLKFLKYDSSLDMSYNSLPHYGLSHRLNAGHFMGPVGAYSNDKDITWKYTLSNKITEYLGKIQSMFAEVSGTYLNYTNNMSGTITEGTHYNLDNSWIVANERPNQYAGLQDDTLIFDDNVVNLYSPDIEYNKDFPNTTLNNTFFRFAGAVCITGSKTSYNSINSQSGSNYGPYYTEGTTPNLDYDQGSFVQTNMSSYALLEHSSLAQPYEYSINMWNWLTVKNSYEVTINSKRGSRYLYSMLNIMIVDDSFVEVNPSSILDPNFNVNNKISIYDPVYVESDSTQSIPLNICRADGDNGRVIYQPFADNDLRTEFRGHAEIGASTVAFRYKTCAHLVTAFKTLDRNEDPSLLGISPTIPYIYGVCNKTTYYTLEGGIFRPRNTSNNSLFIYHKKQISKNSSHNTSAGNLPINQYSWGFAPVKDTFQLTVTPGVVYTANYDPVSNIVSLRDEGGEVGSTDSYYGMGLDNGSDWSKYRTAINGGSDVDYLNLNEKPPYLWLVDLVRDIDIETGSPQYGGQIPISNDPDKQMTSNPTLTGYQRYTATEEVLNNNVWVVCGDATKIESDPSHDSYILMVEGDTYIQRYDCLRVYPYDVDPNSSNVKNANTEGISFICESFINLDGRSDRNRGITNLYYSTPENYGTINYAYSQNNNFFTYRTLDYDLFKANNFPSQFTWSQTKQAGEATDSWTGLNLTSTMDLDGSMGAINKLITYNGELLAFQDKGIANILYNTRVQIPTSDDIPIEIANNLKVSGYRYISNIIGATNKFSIMNSLSGLYFIDSLNKNIHKFGDGLRNLSQELGFKAWSNNNITVTDLDLTDSVNDFITSVDHITGEVYFTKGKETLCLNTNMGKFTSFYDLGDKTPFIFDFNENLFSLNLVNGSTDLYLQRSGVFNNYYGQELPSFIKYVVNPEPTQDKVFNNLDFRADCFDINNKYLPFRTLDHIHVYNEFQDSADTELKVNVNLRKKFRTWRAIIPRDKKETTKGLFYNRIRNPWMYMTLSFNPKVGENTKLQLHDMIVKYTV